MKTLKKKIIFLLIIIITSISFTSCCNFPVHIHEKTDWKTTIEPTCITEGLKVKECLICGEIVESLKLSKIMHNIVDGLCTVCGSNLHSNIDYKTTITFWHAMGMSGYSWIDEVIESFENAYPMFDVKAVSMGDYQTLNSTIINSINAEVTPTIAQAYTDNIAEYLYYGKLASLENYINNNVSLGELVNYTKDTSWNLSSYAEDLVGLTEEEIDDFVDVFYDDGAVYGDGKMYSLPFLKSTEVLYYNKTFFEKYSAELVEYGVEAGGVWRNPTWEQVEGIAEFYQTTIEYKALDTSLKSVAAGFAVDSLSNFFITLTKQWGGEYTGFDANGKGEYLFNNTHSKEAINWFADNFRDGIFGTSQKFNIDYVSDAFKKMQCIMATGSSAGASYYTASNFETGVAEYPQRTVNQNKNVIQQGTNICLFDKENELEKLGGWLFMKWMTNYENSLLCSTTTAFLPIRKSVYNSIEYQEKVGFETVSSKAKQVGLSQQSYFYTTEAFMGSSKARDEAEKLVLAILAGSKVEDAYKVAIDNCNSKI